ncbi:MAG: hypothetical protein ACR2QA_01645 [Solirubrobacteraceae bacterium]
MKLTFTKVTASSSVLAGAAALALSGAAAAAPARTNGAVQFFGTQQGNKDTSDVVTGVITDYGKDVSVGRNAQKIILKKGTFTVDTTKLNANLKFKANRIGCSGEASGSASSLPLSHGTGAYAGITGSFTIHARFTQIGKVVNGKCNLNKEIATNGVISGTGHVSY